MFHNIVAVFFFFFFLLSHFVIKNKKKKKLLGQEKNLKAEKCLKKFLDYILQWYRTSDEKRFCIHFWKLDVIAKLKEQNERKNNITSITSKNVTAIFDNQFDITEEHN